MPGVDRERHHPDRAERIQDDRHDLRRTDEAEPADERDSDSDRGEVGRDLGRERRGSEQGFEGQLRGDGDDETAAEHPELCAACGDVEAAQHIADPEEGHPDQQGVASPDEPVERLHEEGVRQAEERAPGVARALESHADGKRNGGETDEPAGRHTKERDEEEEQQAPGVEHDRDSAVHRLEEEAESDERDAAHSDGAADAHGVGVRAPGEAPDEERQGDAADDRKQGAGAFAVGQPDQDVGERRVGRGPGVGDEHAEHRDSPRDVEAGEPAGSICHVLSPRGRV
nr:hypothetical protein [Subtercola boreus]